MPENPLPLILEPEQLQASPGRDDLVILHITGPARYHEFHVPGALFLDGAHIVKVARPMYGLLPDTAEFAQLLTSLGITPDTHVVAYDDEGGGWASRMLWTLDVAGHKRFSLLNGGLVSWVNEGFPVSQQPSVPVRREACAVDWNTGADSPVADADYILSRLGATDLGLLDARTPEEFSGEKKFAGRGGHIPGARLLNWVDTIDQDRNLRLKPEDQLLDMLHQRDLDRDKEIICYCQSHHRSSHSYIMLKALGYPRIKGYPGAWSDWGNRPDTPVE